MSTEPVTETMCGKCESAIHTRINERPTLKIVLVALGVLLTLIGGTFRYAYMSTDKIERRQWDFSEKMVTQMDFREFKQENNAKLDKIQTAIEAIRR